MKRCVKKNKKKSGSSSDSGSDSGSDSSSDNNNWEEEVEVVIVVEEDEPFHGDDEYSYLDDLALQQQQIQAEELRLAQETQAARKRPTKGKKA